MRTIVSFGLSVVLTGGCASASSQQQGQPEKTQQEKKPARTDYATGVMGCDSKEAAATVASGAEKLEGRTLKLYKDRSKAEISLCDVLKASGKKVAIYQFAGVECLSCRDEAKDIQRHIAASESGKDIAHILVMTDFFVDYEDADFAKFKADFAPKATLAYDEAKLWKAFSEDPTLPNRATIMAMNLATDAILFQKEGEQNGIFDAAVSLLKGQ